MNNIVITLSEYNQFMHLIEQQIESLHDSYNSLLSPYKDHKIPLDDRQIMGEQLKQRQHKLFNQWYTMNKRLKAEGNSYYNSTKLRALGTWVVGASSYKDVITSW